MAGVRCWNCKLALPVPDPRSLQVRSHVIGLLTAANLYDMLHLFIWSEVVALAIQNDTSMGALTPSEGPSPLGFNRCSRSDRVQEVCEQLRSGIFSGRIGAHGHLPSEGELAELLGVSRTVVREAMRSLQTQGLVEKSQGRRARLKPVDAQAVAQSLENMLLRSQGSLPQMLEVRRALELEMVVLACDRADEGQVRGLYEAIDQQRQAPSFQESAEADVLFHQRLAAMTGNQLFELLLESVSGILRETVHRTLVQSGPVPAIDGHLRIADAVRARDRGRAREAMLEHMDYTA